MILAIVSFYYALICLAFGQDPGDGHDHWTNDLEAP